MNQEFNIYEDFITRIMFNPFKIRRLYLGLLKKEPKGNGKYKEIKSIGYKRKMFKFIQESKHELISDREIDFGIAKNNWGKIRAFGIFLSPCRNAHLMAWGIFAGSIPETDEYPEVLTGGAIKILKQEIKMQA